MSTRSQKIELQPKVLRWARERVGYDQPTLARKFGVDTERVNEWEETGEISIARIAKLARFTHTPLGLLYLPESPLELDKLTITDFRAGTVDAPKTPSPNLIDTVHAMQRRQAWMHEELLADGADPLSFVGSCNLQDNPDDVAAAMKKKLKLDSDWAAKSPTWANALRHLRMRAEESGILIVFNGIVGNSTRRKLNRNEFQGFALVDNYAPLIFINGADYKAAQMFTLAHELAHVFIDKSGVSKFKNLHPAAHETEQFCDRVAAEFLVQRDALLAFVNKNPGTDYQQIARQFKVSRVVVARRMLDAKLISKKDFFAFYNEWKKQRDFERERRKGGGNFWNNQNVRIGKLFGDAVKRAVGEGRLFYRDAYALTGLKGGAFDKFLNDASI